MKKIVVLISAAVLAAGASVAAFSVAAGNTSEAARPAKPTGIIALNHARGRAADNTMQKAIDDAATRAAAEQAARDEAARQASAQQAAAQGGNGSSGGGSSEAAAAPSGGGEDLWGVLASFGVPGTSIAYGNTYGYEAISYYRTGYIVINPNHTYDLYTLVAHEINHIVAYRESGKTTEY